MKRMMQMTGWALVSLLVSSGLMPMASAANSAAFFKIDTATRGNWHDGTGHNKVYGQDGYWLIQQATPGAWKSLPAYATVVDPVKQSDGNSASLYAGNSTAVNLSHLLQPNSSTYEDGIWYNNSNGGAFTFDMTLTGSHAVAIYCWDWDGNNNSLKIEALDGDTGATNDTQNVTDYGAGKYFVWIAGGHMKFRLTGGAKRPFASGLFFDPPPGPAISNVTPTNIAATSAYLNGNLTSTGAAPTYVWAYWDTNNWTTNLSLWATNASLGVQPAAGLTWQATGLSANTTYWYAYLASNAFGAAWAQPSQSFKTLGGAPGVNNGVGPSAVGFTTAILNGNLTNGGSAQVLIYWGADTNNWAHTNDFGTLLEGAFSANITGLSPNTTTYYQCKATNAYGTAWSVVTNFTTSPFLGAYYGSPSGAGGRTGINWANAFDSSGVQAAVNAAGAGDTIYLAYGAYSNAATVIISNKSSFTIKGGYAGVAPEPGPTTNLTTVLTRNTANSIGIISANAATVTLDHVTVSDGYLEGYGGGIFATNCTLTLTNCVVANNQTFTIGSASPFPSLYGGGLSLWNCNTIIANSQISSNRQTSSHNDGRTYGAGIYASGGQLTALGVTFYTNTADCTLYVYPYGGAIECDGVALYATNCVFSGNHVADSANQSDAAGGALYLNAGAARIISCMFTSNFAYSGGGNSGRNAYGGALRAGGMTNLVLSACQFTGNYIAGGFYQWGGDLYFIGNTASVVQCSIVSNGLSATYPGEVYIASGVVGITNSLIAKNWGSGIVYAGGSGRISNCTLANNTQYGLNNSAGLAYVKNSIVWGNAVGQINNTTNITYCDVQGVSVLPGIGNNFVDPSFVSVVSNDFHEMSLAGSWHNAANGGAGGWVTDAVYSICIDMADPADSVGLEPDPNGGRLNMGAYGGTIFASKTFGSVDTLPSVANPGATQVRRQSVRLGGQVLSAGTLLGLCPVWYYYWPSGGSTSTVFAGSQSNVFYSSVGNLIGGTTYSYMVLASNGAGSAWSDVKSFTTLGTQPTNWYVALDGNGTSGTDWTAALTTLQDAFNEGVTVGDTICVKSGTYTNGSTLTLINRPGLTVRGGYAGDALGGLPGGASSAPTVITRNTSYSIGIINANASTVTLDRVTVSGGYLEGNGGGIFATNCALTITNCVVAGNQTFCSPSSSFGYLYGGGLSLWNCTALIANSQIAGNSQSNTYRDGRTYGAGIYASGGQLRVASVTFYTNTAYGELFVYPYGGAMQCDGVSLFATNCVFGGNHVANFVSQSDAAGGALYLNSGVAQIISCTFTANFAQAGGVGYSYRNSYGGALQAAGMTNLVLSACRFTGNYATGGQSQWGGALYFAGTTGSVAQCAVVSNGLSATYPGEVYVASGVVGITNSLIAQNWGGGVTVATGTVQLADCTLADAFGGWGLTNAVAVTVKNSIVWNNVAGGIYNTSGATTYSDVQGSLLAGVGNKNVDPLFANAAVGNYQLSRQSPCRETGLNEAWMTTAFDLAGQPRKLGPNVDMGAYEAPYSSPGGVIFVR